MKNKSATDDGYHKTVVFLSDPLEVPFERKLTTVITPSGLTKVFARNYNDGDANVLIWENTGCQIIKTSETIIKHKISLPGIRINYNSKNLTLEYITEGKDNATRNWNERVKPELIKNGIQYTDYTCLPYAPKHKSKNCYDGTVQDDTYNNKQ